MTKAPFEQSVVIMTGMHRSGTSLTASLLQSTGIDFGSRLLCEDNGNIKGHYEDLDFVEFHQQVLASQSKDIAGWTENNKIQVPPAYVAEAQDLITARRNKPIWGWKDPRTTLFLDFWSALIPEAKYVFVYRSPWEVVDSLFRRGDVIFRTNANLAISQWCNYNQAILDFCQSHAEQSLLLEIDSIIHDPETAIAVINDKLNLNLRSPAPVFDATLFTTQINYHRQALITEFFPQAIKIHEQLTQTAVMKQSQLEDRLPDLRAKSWILKDWSQIQQAKRTAQQATQEAERLGELVLAMESSKFWKLRQKWFKLKIKFGANPQDTIYQHYLNPIRIASSQPTLTQAELDLAQLNAKQREAIATAENRYVKWLKKNIPFKNQLKKLIRSVRSAVLYNFAVSIEEHPRTYNLKYRKWLHKNYPYPEQIAQIRQSVSDLDYQPLISIVVPVYNPNKKFLQLAIDSVINQAYPNWELCLADDCSTKGYVAKVLKTYAEQDERIKVVWRSENGHISRASNSALEVATGEYVALLDHDDLLAPHALAEVVKLLNKHPEADFIYSDEDKIDEQNFHADPAFKQDWCPDSFLSKMYTCHLGVYRRAILKQIGGFRAGFEGSQDYDLVLRVTEQTVPEKIFHIPDILYHWRVHLLSTAASADAKPYAYIAGQKAISEAIARRGEPGEVIRKENYPGVYTVRYDIAAHKLVSIIIPTKDLAHTLNVCLDSIFTKSTYPNYEVIVIDNGSVEPQTAECLEYWQKQQPERFRYFAYDIPFNYSQLNNYGAAQAEGDFLLFLNNDTEIITADWIEAMVEQAQRKSIGAVGTLLLYPDNNTIQHAGVVVGLGGVAGHGHKFFSPLAPGHVSQIISTNNYSAVTGACMMCRREAFEEVGGFEENLAIAFNDVDFCLKLTSRGYFNVYLPHVILHHYESKSRGLENNPHKQERFDREVAYMQQKWRQVCDRDPCYNPNLTRNHVDYRLNI